MHEKHEVENALLQAEVTRLHNSNNDISKVLKNTQLELDEMEQISSDISGISDRSRNNNENGHQKLLDLTTKAGLTIDASEITDHC